MITAVCLPASSRVPADDLVQVKNKGEIANVLVTQGGGGETQGYLSGKKSAAIPNFSFCGVQFSLERSLFFGVVLTWCQKKNVFDRLICSIADIRLRTLHCNSESHSLS